MSQALLRFNPREYLAQFPFYSSADRKFRFVRDEVLGPDAYHAVMNRMLAEHDVDTRALAPARRAAMIIRARLFIEVI